jgi:amino acid transporter
MWFAFARDGGMPGSRRIATVNARTGAPVVAILVTSALSVLVSLYAAAFTVLTSASTITLYLAYGIPVALNLRNRLRRRGEHATPETAPWNLKRSATLINILAIMWILFITVVFALPPNELVLWTTLLVALALAAYWLLYARRHFHGPSLRS